MLAKKPFYRVSGPGLVKPKANKIVDINFKDAKFEQMLRGQNLKAPLLGVKTIYDTQPWTETVDIVNEAKENYLTYQKAINVLHTKKGADHKFVAGPLKNTVIVDYDGFQPRDHMKLQRMKNKVQTRTSPRRKLIKKKFSLSLPMLKETLSRIKVPNFKELFRQARHSQEQKQYPVFTESLQELDDGRKITEGYRMRGLDRPVVNKHKISLSEFDEIKSIVLNDERKGADAHSNSVPPHLIYLQDFN